jgi:modulator of FtsH protease
VAYHPEQWHDFATSFAGAAGALLGLAFVAISFNLDLILRDKVLPGRAVETLAFFAYPLAGSLLIQLPGLSDTALGLGQAILTAGLAGLIALGVRRWRQEEAKPLSLRLGHLVPAVVLAILALVGALATTTASFGGLYWLAGAMATATTAGIVNSWVLLVEIKR